jgi:hypothetical protein
MAKLLGTVAFKFRTILETTLALKEVLTNASSQKSW